jgi:predicted permease
MSVILTIILPVFGLIAFGYICGRTKILAPATGQGLSDFAFTLGIPALLFHTVATAKFGDLSPFAVWTSYFGAAALTWGTAAALTPTLLGRPRADGPSIAMSSVFGNTAMLGLPLAIAAFGAVAAAPAALVLSIHAPVLWLAGMLHSAAVSAKGRTSAGAMAAALAGDLARNPIVLAILAGALWRLTRLDLPLPINRLVELLAQAGVPASLVALGLTLVGAEVKGQGPTLALISGLKLVLMPLVAWALAAHVFALPPLQLAVIVILAAMPTGGNAFLFAVKEGRAVNSASGSVALGTVLAAVTASVVISLLRP